MSRFVLLFAVVTSLFCFLSCKKTGPVKACFTFSKETPKVNDTLYLLNCSENYTKFIWLNTNGFYPGGALIDSTNRHQKVVVTAAGDYVVALAVGDEDMTLLNYNTKASVITKTIKVSP